MRASLLTVIFCCLASCGSSAKSNDEPTAIVQQQMGDGFWCIGPACFRTRKACEVTRERDGQTGNCERSGTALCFVGVDRDNMVSYTVCGRDQASCNQRRVDYRGEYEWMNLSPCRLTR